MRLRCPPRGEDSGVLFRRASLAVDELEIAQIYEETGPLAEDKNGIFTVYCVGEKGRAARHAEKPERNRNDASSLALAAQPLYEKARGEQGLAQKSYSQPEHALFHGGTFDLWLRIVSEISLGFQWADVKKVSSKSIIGRKALRKRYQGNIGAAFFPWQAVRI